MSAGIVGEELVYAALAESIALVGHRNAPVLRELMLREPPLTRWADAPQLLVVCAL